MSRRWPYVAVTAVLAVLTTVWAIPHLDDGAATGYSPLSDLTSGQAGAIHVWIRGGDLLGVSLATHIDGLAASLLLLAAGVALLVQIYSTAYLGDDPRYRSYASIVILFLLGMIAVVAADDFFVLLIGWEVMGLCSYLLISHEWGKEPARAGAVKAFLITRFGDLGMLIAILTIGQTYGTYRISEVLAVEPQHATGIGLLLLLAVVAKSAQFPLHTWLPDAMPGPTPISALIHAATMVAAGVYLVARLLPLFAASELVMTLLALIACTTMLMGALFALTGSDLKRILAWSTVSQLAYMFAALAVGDRAAGIDHLLSHGAFKALLFLAAGCLMHAVGTSALSSMGGLRLSMPATFAATTVGLAALAGVVPTSGFFTKDEIIAAAHRATEGDAPVSAGIAWLVLVVALVTAFVTAAYAARLWVTVFFGPAQQAHDAPRTMTLPIVILAITTLALSIGKPVHLGVGLLTTFVAAAGIGLVWWLRERRIRLPLDWLRRPLRAELGIDTAFTRWIPAMFAGAARAVVVIDRDGVDSYSRSTSYGAELGSRLLNLGQSKNVQRYASALAVGVLVLAAFAVVWS
ncbi:MAG: NADH-quinone oxidoreductase subunit L [Kineosporiaceae bacterium]|nr:NADH-quinone oxidoreductase subunit L [Aeromicrobium sp.]